MMMKLHRKIQTILIVIFSLFLTLGVTFAFGRRNTAKADESFFKLQGASIRFESSENAEDNGIRFSVLMDTASYDTYTAESDVVIGTLIVPTDIYSAPTLENVKSEMNPGGAENVITFAKEGGVETVSSIWKDYTITEKEATAEFPAGTYKQAIVYMYGIPAASYNRGITARGYVQVGESAAVYTDSLDRCIDYVALAAINSGDYDGEDAESVARKADLQAYLNANTYEVKFFEEDGTTQIGKIQSLKYGDTFTLPETNPTKTGYTFRGWALGDAETVYDFEADGAMVVTDDMMFNAKFEINTVTFVDVDGTSRTIEADYTTGLTEEIPLPDSTFATTIYFDGVQKETLTVDDFKGLTKSVTVEYKVAPNASKYNVATQTLTLNKTTGGWNEHDAVSATSDTIVSFSGVLYTETHFMQGDAMASEGSWLNGFVVKTSDRLAGFYFSWRGFGYDLFVDGTRTRDTSYFNNGNLDENKSSLKNTYRITDIKNKWLVTTNIAMQYKVIVIDDTLYFYWNDKTEIAGDTGDDLWQLVWAIDLTDEKFGFTAGSSYQIGGSARTADNKKVEFQGVEFKFGAEAESEYHAAQCLVGTHVWNEAEHKCEYCETAQPGYTVTAAEGLTVKKDGTVLSASDYVYAGDKVEITFDYGYDKKVVIKDGDTVIAEAVGAGKLNYPVNADVNLTVTQTAFTMSYKGTADGSAPASGTLSQNKEGYMQMPTGIKWGYSTVNTTSAAVTEGDIVIALKASELIQGKRTQLGFALGGATESYVRIATTLVTKTETGYTVKMYLYVSGSESSYTATITGDDIILRCRVSDADRSIKLYVNGEYAESASQWLSTKYASITLATANVKSIGFWLDTRVTGSANPDGEHYSFRYTYVLSNYVAE